MFINILLSMGIYTFVASYNLYWMSMQIMY